MVMHSFCPQEMYWRIPSRMSPDELKCAADLLVAPTSLGEGTEELSARDKWAGPGEEEEGEESVAVVDGEIYCTCNHIKLCHLDYGEHV